jgi:hypothetical protein
VVTVELFGNQILGIRVLEMTGTFIFHQERKTIQTAVKSLQDCWELILKLLITAKSVFFKTRTLGIKKVTIILIALFVIIPIMKVIALKLKMGQAAFF